MIVNAVIVGHGYALIPGRLDVTRAAGRSAGEVGQFMRPEDLSLVPAPCYDIEIAPGAFGVGQKLLLICLGNDCKSH